MAELRRRRWAFMTTHTIADLHNPEDVHLRRTRIVQTPLGGIYIHRFERPDNDRHLHDHPWSFVTLVLRGGYTEDIDVQVPGSSWGRGPYPTRRTWQVGSVHRMSAVWRHSVRRLLSVPTWTLIIVGPRRRAPWGFWTEDGFIAPSDYLGYLTTQEGGRG